MGSRATVDITAKRKTPSLHRGLNSGCQACNKSLYEQKNSTHRKIRYWQTMFMIYSIDYQSNYPLLSRNRGFLYLVLEVGTQTFNLPLQFRKLEILIPGNTRWASVFYLGDNVTSTEKMQCLA
jgi:hypothetical protein